ncbi:hypothetical protein IWX90DRAFT_166474 [Phyllosticta citrichinensis]|uniref:Amine oxidase domain-containing protein n=1 Tax=Phyllosticta citrichinensis TaxID=1130410 RepID=A0ABR1Y0Y1_9PEZI
MTKSIAIVGSGVTGIGALYALRDTEHEIHLFESSDRLGGHTNTLDFKHCDETVPVDTGFIVLNTATYPNFQSFLKHLNVETNKTEMTFGISRDQGKFEWAGTSLNAVFAQRSNIFRPSHWRMIFDIIRFNQFALDLLKDESSVSLNLSIGRYLDREGYSAAFRDNYLIPMTACVWSTGADKCALDFPAVTLVRFLWNHHLLNTITERPAWLTVKGGSRNYIDAVMKDFPSERVHLSSGVRSLRNTPDGKVALRFARGREQVFDQVLLACHGDQAWEIIAPSASAEELKILGAFHTSLNRAYLHSDVSLMPRNRATWSAWNYLTTSNPKGPKSSPSGALGLVSLTYNMNILQHIPVSKYGHVLVTMNPPHPPKQELTQANIPYTHPLYTANAVYYQGQLHKIQGTRGVFYAGAWTRYGFHEDGFLSGINIACDHFGGDVPWERVETKTIRGNSPEFSTKDYAARVVIHLISILIRILELFLALFTVPSKTTLKRTTSGRRRKMN